jgi:branched-chain amino acid transport system permease protein
MFTLPILSQVLVNGLSLSAIYVLVALGFTLLFGIMRVVNFAHGAFAMLGGYALFYAYGSLKLPYPIAVLGSALTVASFGLIFEVLVYRWFYQKMFQSMIGLMGLTVVVLGLVGIRSFCRACCARCAFCLSRSVFNASLARLLVTRS